MGTPQGRPQRVLIVDDNPDIREFIEDLLDAAGYEAVTASNGDEALALLRERRADIVVTDLFMPERDGLETIDALRREFPDVGVVAISGDRQTPGGITQYLAVAQVAGADRTLRKPFTAEALLEAVRAAARSAAQ